MSWFKDGKKIKVKHKGGRFRGGWEVSDDTQWLQISSATAEDKGLYTLRVENSVGYAEAQVDVTVQQPKKDVVIEDTTETEEAPAVKKEPVKDKKESAKEEEEMEEETVKEEKEKKPKGRLPEFKTFPEPVNVIVGEKIRLSFTLAEGIYL